MINLLLLPFLINGFIQKWYIPYGTIAPGGRILVYDSDHDGRIELIFRRWIPESFGVYFAEFVPPDSWDIIESQTVDSVLVWDISDYDNDTFSDLVVHGDASGNGAPIPIIAIYESPDSFSYPTQEVWRDTVGQPAVAPISVYDIDQDGFPEIIDNNGSGQPHWIWVYESTGNNQYDTVCTFNPMTDTFPQSSVSTHAFGDFDGDGNIEFVMGDLSAGSFGADYWVFESPANNTYEQIFQGYVQTKNIKDCFSVPDADEDGQMEFVVKGYVIPSAEIHAFIFEATGDNTYEIIKTFTLPGGDYYGGYSDAGDVDGDSIPEIVLEARQNVFIIKAGANDSFYVWDTLPGHNSGSSIAVYDIDENGLSEIIISGNDETRIYEYDPGGMEETALRPLPNALRLLELSPNPFIQTLNIKFQTQTEKEVNIKVYDVTGRLVKNIYKGSIKGTNILKWNSEDENGRPVAQGIYFIRVENLDTGETLCKKVLRIE